MCIDKVLQSTTECSKYNKQPMYYEVPWCAGAPQMMLLLLLLSSLSCHHCLCHCCHAVVVIVDNTDVYIVVQLLSLLSQC